MYVILRTTYDLKKSKNSSAERLSFSGQMTQLYSCLGLKSVKRNIEMNFQNVNFNAL